ncbi:uncharacterized protein LTR77_006168 [Saxophila tyrrhenica]|uniref:Uncharacterized protein n=1 Tax=Saxophila tyrrhenica TaxID=1690608 RepID=A0AAV9PA63_9PEZI|nr:hypothetical protein LTR77_006168 [Saxophila tyrrhenica]
MDYDHVNVYTADNVYAQGSTINFSWSTSYQTISVTLWQNDNDTFSYLLKEVPAVSTLAWYVDLYGRFDLDAGEVFFLTVWDEGADSDDQFSSHYFNITGPDPPRSTSSAASSTTAFSIPGGDNGKATSTSAGSTASPTSSKAASNSSSSSSGLSSGAKAGIGVGVGVGVLGIAIGAALAFFYRRRSRKSETNASQSVGEWASTQQAAPSPYSDNYGSPPMAKYAYQPLGYQDPPIGQQWPGHGPQEMSGVQQDSVELPNSPK